ncbi:hypothetical protein B0H34DRAFT_695068 [Crassisporium funariophilum]|nr:hypothetical protein B0H34DRAFT_695068 [Crassisporium funariophilum]
MFRLCRIPAHSSIFRPWSQRNLVSSALLMRTWQNETIGQLRQEAKILGLSPKGNKATLISRLEEHEKNVAYEPVLPTLSAGVRHVSTGSTPSASSEAPGIPEMPQIPIPSTLASFLDVKIPDLSQSDPLPPVQIPYVPDFWDSSPVVETEAEVVLPKLLVVAGSDTHHGGGPSHNLLDITLSSDGIGASSSSSPPMVTHSSGERGLLDDMAEDIGLPPTKDVKSAIWKLFS